MHKPCILFIPMHNPCIIIHLCKYAPRRRATSDNANNRGGVFCMHMWITLWITCGYVDNFLFVYGFVLCVYGFLWVESDKFYMFECVVDNLWITPDTKTYQKINCLTFNKNNRKRKKKRKKKPRENVPGISVVCVLLSWLPCLWWLHRKNY